MTMTDWLTHGRAYAAEMIATSRAFAAALDAAGIPVYGKEQGFTRSHQFAVEAEAFGGGQTASKKLRKAGFLACGIGLPIAPVEGDLNGLRIGTPELVRWGVTRENVGEIAALVARALTTNDPESLVAETRALRGRYQELHFVSR
jgi:glycine hydroxymethyltransferase